MGEDRSRDLLVGDIFANAAVAVPDHDAAVFGEHRLTFQELDTRSNLTATALATAGVNHGDRVALLVSTSLDGVLVFAACAKLGAVFVPVPSHLQRHEAAQVLTVAQPRLVIYDQVHAEVGSDLATTMTIVHRRLDQLTEAPAPDLIRSPVATCREAQPGDRGGAGDRGSAGERGSAEGRAEVSESDPHVIFFTSGSTGRPKGVVLSHRTSVLRTHPGSQLEPRGSLLCVYPLFHMAAWTLALQQWQARDTVVFVEQNDGPAICEAIARHGIARLNAVPAVWDRVVTHLEAQRTRGGPGILATLRFADTGTSFVSDTLVRRIMKACPNANLRIFYGSTEAGNVTSLSGLEVERRHGSIGLPGTNQTIHIESSELWVRGPLLFDGYFGDDEATEAAMGGGWFHTGDLVRTDEDGFLSVVGRASDLIRTGGEWVSPLEVEAVLAEVVGVEDVAVVGIPDERFGEMVCAVVVPEGGRDDLSLEELRAQCTGRLASFKHPRLMQLITALPRTEATGQVRRQELVTLVQHDGVSPRSGKAAFST